MRVAHYATSISRSAGGLYYSVSGLAKAQKSAGLDVLVIGGADDHFEVDREQWGSVRLRPHPVYSRYGLSAQVMTQLANFKPDIVHIHGMWSGASVYARISSAMGVPVVVAPRGMLDPWILRQKPLVKHIHGQLLERPLLRRAHVHALNDSERSAVGKYLPQALPRTFVVPNGVDDILANPAGARVARSGALYLGRLHAKKQVLELVRLWGQSPRLQAIQLTVAGWGDSAYEAELRSAVKRADNVVFVGPSYGSEKSDILQSARLFILPSLSEGLPMSVLEALNAGAIPVITDQCNLPELFTHDVAVRIESDMSDIDQVVDGVLRRGEHDLDRLSEAGLRFAQRYRWPAIALQMQKHYDRIIENDVRIR